MRAEIKTRDVRLDTGSIRPIVMDVRSPSSISTAAEKVTNAVDKGNPLVGVVNNAGLCMISPMELTPKKAVRDLFELDSWAFIRVIQTFLPLMKKYQGRLINVSSMGGYVNPPMWVVIVLQKLLSMLLRDVGGSSSSRLA